MKSAVRRVLLMSALMSPGRAVRARPRRDPPEFRAESALRRRHRPGVGAQTRTCPRCVASLASQRHLRPLRARQPGLPGRLHVPGRRGRRTARTSCKVTSPRPVTEPFVTLLVEANWPRGRLLREYTVLLDPPVYAPAARRREPVAAAPGCRLRGGAAGAARGGAEPSPRRRVRTPRRGAPAGAVRPPARPRRSTPGSTYRVRSRTTRCGKSRVRRTRARART